MDAELHTDLPPPSPLCFLAARPCVCLKPVCPCTAPEASDWAWTTRFVHSEMLLFSCSTQKCSEL